MHVPKLSWSKFHYPLAGLLTDALSWVAMWTEVLHLVYLALTWSQRKHANNTLLLSVLSIPGKVGEGNHSAPDRLHCPALPGVGGSRERGSSLLYSRFWPQFHSWFRLKTVDVPTISAQRKPLTKLTVSSSAKPLTLLPELRSMTTSHSGLGLPAASCPSLSELQASQVCRGSSMLSPPRLDTCDSRTDQVPLTERQEHQAVHVPGVAVGRSPG